jgi:hypothetical protein
MQLSEKELEDFIFQDLVDNDGFGLVARGLHLRYTNLRMKSFIKPIWTRQLNLDPYGIADIVGFYRYRGIACIELIELKARPIELKDFEQIARYDKALTRFMNNTLKWSNFDINKTLIGTGYDGMYIQTLLPVSVASCTYDLDGLEFNHFLEYTDWHIRADKGKSLRNLFPKFIRQHGKAIH